MCGYHTSNKIFAGKLEGDRGTYLSKYGSLKSGYKKKVFCCPFYVIPGSFELSLKYSP